MLRRSEIKYLLFVAVALAAAGCQTETARRTYYPAQSAGDETSAGSPERYTDAESLLNGEGYLVMVEEDDEASPVEQHMKARVQVKPDEIKGSKNYTSHGKAPHEQTHLRTFRIASSSGDQKAPVQEMETIVVPEAKPERVPKFLAEKPALISSNLKLKELSTKKPEKFAAAPGSGQSFGAAIVKDIRLGEHPGKTRFVLDMTGPSKFEYELNNEKGYLLIDLPGVTWEADAKEILQAHPLIKGYSVRTDDKGTKILVALKKPGRLITSVALPPNSTRGHRIYFDIGAAG